MMRHSKTCYWIPCNTGTPQIKTPYLLSSFLRPTRSRGAASSSPVFYIETWNFEFISDCWDRGSFRKANFRNTPASNRYRRWPRRSGGAPPPGLDVRLPEFLFAPGWWNLPPDTGPHIAAFPQCPCPDCSNISAFHGKGRSFHRLSFIVYILILPIL